MPAERAAAALGAEAVVAAFSTLFGAGNVLLGVSLALSDPARLSPLSFGYILQIMPGRGWGVLFLGTGVLALIGQWWVPHWSARLRGHPLEVRPVQFGHFIAGIAACFWAYAFARGAWEAHQLALAAAAAGLPQPPKPSLTGIAAYLMIGLGHLILSATRPRWDVRGDAG